MKVLCTSSHPIDLSDGRTLAPIEVVDDVDVDHPHQRSLITDGHLTVVTPKKRQSAHSDKEGS